MSTARTITLVASLSLVVLLQTACATRPDNRCGFWIDVYNGEPVSYTDLVDDLAGVRVVYLGERHTLERHHDLQERIVRDLAARGVPLVLALEQLEYPSQPALDRYNEGEIDFDELAKETDWAKRWSNYEQYRPVVEAAHAAGAPVLALNARSETIRQVGRKGLEGLPPETRAELPVEIVVDDPMYRSHLNRVLMVHAHMPEAMMKTVFEAQVSRDETMADRLCAFLKSPAGEGRCAVVLCGSGHVSHAMGTPSRVRRRMPEITDRILVLTGSGDVEISEKMRAMTREITITHKQLRELTVPIADYLHATSLKPEP